MAILMIGTDPNGTAEVADRWAANHGKLRQAPGFIFHADGPLEGGGWQIVEAWESREAFEAFFDANVRPNIDPAELEGRPPKIIEVAHLVR